MSEHLLGTGEPELIEHTEDYLKFRAPFFAGHVVVMEYADGTNYKTYSDGARVTYDDDGTIITRFENHVVVLEHPDGRVKEMLY